MMSNISDQTDYRALWFQRGKRLISLAAELEETRRQRDMLATRCAEQAKQLAAMHAPFAPPPEMTVCDAIAAIDDAIATMQRQGVR